MLEPRSPGGGGRGGGGDYRMCGKEGGKWDSEGVQGSV